MIKVGRGVSKTVTLELFLELIQNELCKDCPVREYSNRNCKNCKNNIKEKFDEYIF